MPGTAAPARKTSPATSGELSADVLAIFGHPAPVFAVAAATNRVNGLIPDAPVSQLAPWVSQLAPWVSQLAPWGIATGAMGIATGAMGIATGAMGIATG